MVFPMGSVTMDPLSSSSRIMRNLAEKMRRDKLNMYINELATLVPMVASSTKRMDKTSILRLSATFLRMHRTLNSTDLQMQLLPSYLELANVSQQMLENMEGFMLIVTSSGKIVFISEMVEKLLGHTQMDLMGQSIYGITHPDDHEEMKRNLALNEDSSDSSFTDSQSGEDSSSEDASTSTQSEASPRPSYPPSSGVPPPDSSQVNQRRSFYVRLAERAVSRGDPSRYELIHMVGHLRSPQQPEASPSTQSRRRQREPASTVNDYVLVAVARHVRDHRVTELSLMEAVKDEYVTRHLLDGRIIFVDHRISVVAGYLTEEVSGMSAFTFMHQEDSRWTMIALRQMYGSPEGCGSSVYRLLAKNGQFIYLRTHGYLEFDKNTQKVESFICVNTLISDEEGAQGILDMKERYSPTGSAQTPALMPNDADAEETEAEKPPEEVKATNNNVSDDNPSVEQLVEQILSPVCIEERCSPSPLPDTQYVKAALYGKSLPPASLQASKVGIPIQAQQLKGQAVSPKPASPDTIGSSVQQAVVVQDNVCKKSKQTVDTGVVDSAMQEVVLNRPMVPESLSSVQVNKVMVAYTATSFGGNTSVQTHVITQSPPGPEGVGLHVQMATSQQHINKGMVLSPNSLAALVPNSSNCTNVSSSHMFSQPPEGHIQIAHKPQEYKIKDSMKETVQRNAIYTCMSSPGQCVEYNLVQNVGAEVPTVQLKNAVTERRTVHQHVLKRPLSDPSMLENVKRLHTSRTERNISRVYTETDSNILSAEVQTSDGCSDLVNFLQTDRNLSNVDVPSANLLSEALFPPEKETDLKCETSATSFAVPEPSNNEETDSWLGALISPDQTEIQADGDNVDTDFSNFDLTDMQGDSKEFIDLFDIADAPKQNLPQNITSSFEDQNGEFELSKVERIYRLKGDQVWEETPETILQPTGVQSPPRQQETLDFEQQLIRRHVQLESRMQLQENQINTIEQDLHQVPLQNIGGEIYRSNLSHIRAKHKEQTQMLKNLRQEHQNMHKDKLKLCGNVGV